MDGDNPDEDFPPTSGRVFGILAIVLAAVIVVGELVDGGGVEWTGVAFGVLLASVSWAALLRPRVAIKGDDLVLRTMVATVWLPLGAIDDVVVRQYLVVRAGGKRFTSPAVGRSRRAITKESGMPRQRDPDLILEEGKAFAVFVEERIRERAGRTRDRLGIELGSAEQDVLAAQVRREPAVPEIVTVLGSLVAFVLLLVL